FPVNSRAFHGNVGDTISYEPACTFQQIPSHGAKRRTCCRVPPRSSGVFSCELQQLDAGRTILSLACFSAEAEATIRCANKRPVTLLRGLRSRQNPTTSGPQVLINRSSAFS